MALMVIDPAVRRPELQSFNAIALRSPVPVSGDRAGVCDAEPCAQIFAPPPAFYRGMVLCRLLGTAFAAWALSVLAGSGRL